MTGRALALVGAAKLIQGVGYTWAAAITLLQVVGLVVRFRDADTVWQGFMAVGWALSPWNIWGYVLMLIAVLPAIAALKLAEKLQRAAAPPRSEVAALK